MRYLYTHYDYKTCSIEICVTKFKRQYLNANCPSIKQVYNWINEGKIKLSKNDLCYKKRRSNKSSMMNHTKWNLDNKTVLPISLRPKYINKRDEIGHLEIDSILGKRNEYDSVISIVDRCTRRVWLIKSQYKQEYYTANLIYNFIIKNEITVKSITVDNGMATLYVNGNLIQTKALKMDMPQTASDFNLGGDNRDGNPFYFKGSIYSVNLFDDVRTAQEIMMDKVLL